jgi:hypothetical protein
MLNDLLPREEAPRTLFDVPRAKSNALMSALD